MAFKFPWSTKDSHRDDPYWDFFLNTAPADRANTVIELMRNAPAGNIFPTKAELHTPEITASHVKGMAEYFGADVTGIAKLDSASAKPDDYPFAILCAVRADYDPRIAKGIGGQMPVQNGSTSTSSGDSRPCPSRNRNPPLTASNPCGSIP